MRLTIMTLAVAVFAGVQFVTPASAAEQVNIGNFVRAESDRYFKAKVDKGLFGKIGHNRNPPPLDNQMVIRTNRDTLYSYGIFDLTTPVTIVKPKTEGRFQSMVVTNQDHNIKLVAYDAGEYALTQEMIGTRYVQVTFRTLANPVDTADLEAAYKAQDGIEWRQKRPGRFELPDWDQETLVKVRAAILGLVPFVPDSTRMFGDKDEVDPVRFLIGTAAGWGGNRTEDAIYLNITPEGNDGTTPHILHVPEVPVDGFWSVTVYNAKGFYEAPENAVSVNNVTAKKDPDGSITVHFGGDPKRPNYLRIMPGWNYIVRLYRPRKEITDGSWKFPLPEPAR